MLLNRIIKPKTRKNNPPPEDVALCGAPGRWLNVCP
jgi:hypothetical protein